MPGHENWKRGRLRLAGRWLVLLAAMALAWPRSGSPWTSVLLPAVSPHIAIGSVLAVRSVTLLTLAALPVVVLALFFPRWFCRHACPTGFLQEMLERLRPTAAAPSRRLPPLGKWILLFTLGGAFLGYPVLLWLDPLALFNGLLGSWRQPLALVSLLAGAGLPLLLIIDLLWPRVWCQRLCPLGATQDLLALPRQRLRAAFRCEAAAPSEGTAPGASYVGRRGFFGVLFGAGGALLLRQARGQGAPPIRPPGAIAEARFPGVCVRCGNCAQVCPSRIIQPDLGAHGLAALLTPSLRFDEDYCREDCHRCNQVCPSGAIERLSLAQKRSRVIGPARVDLDLCLLAEGKECTVCIRRCPFQAIAIQTSPDGFANQPRIDFEKCNGCGACEAACPTRPRRAIRVVAGSQETHSSAINQ